MPKTVKRKIRQKQFIQNHTGIQWQSGIILKFFTSQVGDTNTISTQDKNLNINLNSEIPVFGDFKIHDDAVII